MLMVLIVEDDIIVVMIAVTVTILLHPIAKQILVIVFDTIIILIFCDYDYSSDVVLSGF